MTLQDMIAAAIGAQEKAPPPQAPSEAPAQRDLARVDRAKEVESLAPLLFEVVRTRGHWRTRHANKGSSPFPDQASAIAAAKKLAIAKRKRGHEVKVVLQRTDGKEVIQALDDEPGQSGGE